MLRHTCHPQLLEREYRPAACVCCSRPHMQGLVLIVVVGCGQRTSRPIWVVRLVQQAIPAGHHAPRSSIAGFAYGCGQQCGLTVLQRGLWHMCQRLEECHPQLPCGRKRDLYSLHCAAQRVSIDRLQTRGRVGLAAAVHLGRAIRRAVGIHTVWLSACDTIITLITSCWQCCWSTIEQVLQGVRVARYMLHDDLPCTSVGPEVMPSTNSYSRCSSSARTVEAGKSRLPIRHCCDCSCSSRSRCADQDRQQNRP